MVDIANWMYDRGLAKNQVPQYCVKIGQFMCYATGDTEHPFEFPFATLSNRRNVSGFLAHLRSCNLQRLSGFTDALKLYIDYLQETVEPPVDSNVAASLKTWLTTQAKRAKVVYDRSKEERLSRETLEEKGEWATLEELSDLLVQGSTRYKDIVREAKAQLELSTTDLKYCTVYAICLLLQNSKAGRGGEPAELRLMDVTKALEEAEGKRFVSVKKFKTAAKYKYSVWCLEDPTVRKAWKHYLAHIRPLLVRGDDPGYFFLNTAGKKVFNIGTSINQMFQKLGGPGWTRKVNPTQYRAYEATEAQDRGATEEDARVMAGNRNHGGTTAKLYYIQQQRKVQAAQASSVRQKLRMPRAQFGFSDMDSDDDSEALMSIYDSDAPPLEDLVDEDEDEDEATPEEKPKEEKKKKKKKKKATEKPKEKKKKKKRKAEELKAKKRSRKE